jgi:hypothetical protein
LTPESAHQILDKGKSVKSAMHRIKYTIKLC